jgi:hypothetical protein
MFIKYYVIDWWLLFSNFVWILGIAITIATFSYHEFLTMQQKVKKLEIFRKSSFKKSIFLGLILIGVGLFLTSLNSSNNFSSAKFRFIDYNIYKPEEIEKFDDGEALIISTHKMEMNKNYLISKNKISMWWNGYIGTPFMKFVSGQYAIEFEAYGSEALNEYSKILISFLVLKNKNLILKKLLKEIELTEIKRKYFLKFETEKNQIGRIRIQFFNDGGDEKGGDRNVWIEGLKIRKLIAGK